ncbi:hypothetical protein EQG41_18065 [Billgrantia azerbaijanica]|nr:hypothetical protein EQG41_18065 [Halomonas azerbaijanica]
MMGMDNGMDASPSWQEMEAERDAAVEQVAYWRERAVSAERESAALAAYSEELIKFVDEVPYMTGRHRDAERMRLLSNSPTTSLARRDAAMKIEAFVELANDLALNADNARENGYTAAADVMQDAADYALTKAEVRRQAEVES